MKFFEQIKNGGFEVIDASGEAISWVGSRNQLSTLYNNEFGSGQFCMKLTPLNGTSLATGTARPANFITHYAEFTTPTYSENYWSYVDRAKTSPNATIGNIFQVSTGAVGVITGTAVDAGTTNMWLSEFRTHSGTHWTHNSPVGTYARRDSRPLDSSGIGDGAVTINAIEGGIYTGYMLLQTTAIASASESISAGDMVFNLTTPGACKWVEATGFGHDPPWLRISNTPGGGPLSGNQLNTWTNNKTDRLLVIDSGATALILNTQPLPSSYEVITEPAGDVFTTENAYMGKGVVGDGAGIGIITDSNKYWAKVTPRVTLASTEGFNIRAMENATLRTHLTKKAGSADIPAVERAKWAVKVSFDAVCSHPSLLASGAETLTVSLGLTTIDLPLVYNKNGGFSFAVPIDSLWGSSANRGLVFTTPPSIYDVTNFLIDNIKLTEELI